MKKVFVLLTLLGLVLTPYVSKAGPKEDQKKAANTDLEVTGYSTAVAIAAEVVGAETVATMFWGQALSSGVSYIQNKRGVKKYNDGSLYDPNADLDLDNGALATLNTLSNHLKNTDGRIPASSLSEEEMREEMGSFVEKLEAMDQIDTKAGLSKEELIDSLKAGLEDETPSSTSHNNSNASYNPQFRLTSSSGYPQENDFDYSEMFSGMFSGQEKDVNENYIGNIPTRYLAQNTALSIWDRISLKTKKLLKQ